MRLLALLIACSSLTCIAQTAERPRLLLALYDKHQAIVLEPDNTISRTVKVPGSCQDAWLLGDDSILLSGGREVKKVGKDGKVAWTYKATHTGKIEIHNCQPLKDGGVLIGEGGTNRLLEFDANGKIVKEVKTSVKGGAHNEFRGLRKTGRGTYLFCAKGEDTIYELDANGKQLRKITKADVEKQGVKWNALHFVCELPNGNLFVGGGYNSSFCEIDAKGKVVWNLTNKDLPTVNLTYCAGAQILKDGTMVLSLYNSSHKVIAISRKKELLWGVDKSAFAGKPTHVFVIGSTAPRTR